MRRTPPPRAVPFIVQLQPPFIVQAGHQLITAGHLLLPAGHLLFLPAIFNPISESTDSSIQGVFTSHANPKYFFFHPSHQIFKRMHGALNIDKKDN
jgi:hypothetical protein